MSCNDNNNTSPTMPSRPSFTRSNTTPAFCRALLMPSVNKPFAVLRASSTKGLQRMSTFRKASTASSTSTIRPSTSVKSIPTTPDYTQLAASCAPPSEIVSSLTRPTPKRATTMPAPVRVLRSTALAKIPAIKKAVCEWPPHKASVSSVESVSSVSTTSTRRRSSSVASVESFTSNENQVTLGLRLRAFPSTILGLLTSIMAVILISILPDMGAETPKRKPAQRPCERDILLTDEQERNPPKLSRSTPTSQLSRRTLRRVARARRATTSTEALAVLFAPMPKRVRASIPAHVDPKTLTSEIPLTVYSSPIALPLQKGPAPTVRPARKAPKFTLLATVKEESTDAALCSGW